MLRVRTAMLVVLSGVLLCGVVNAGPITAVEDQEFLLSDLVGSDGFIWRDKLFYDFSFTATAGGGALAPAGDVKVVAADLGGEVALLFNAFWVANAGQWVDTTIRYKVQVRDPLLFIDRVVLGAGAMTATGTGAAVITESVFDLPGLTELANLAIFDSPPDLRLTREEAPVGPLKDIYVVKDIGVTGGTTGFGSISEIWQIYGQVPEPMSLGILAVGSLVLARRRRR